MFLVSNYLNLKISWQFNYKLWCLIGKGFVKFLCCKSRFQFVLISIGSAYLGHFMNNTCFFQCVPGLFRPFAVFRGLFRVFRLMEGQRLAEGRHNIRDAHAIRRRKNASPQCVRIRGASSHDCGIFRFFTGFGMRSESGRELLRGRCMRFFPNSEHTALIFPTFFRKTSVCRTLNSFRLFFGPSVGIRTVFHASFRYFFKNIATPSQLRDFGVFAYLASDFTPLGTFQSGDENSDLFPE